MHFEIDARRALLRRAHVVAATGLPLSTIYGRIKAGTFPAPVKIGARSVGWRCCDIDAWLADPAGYHTER
ncbi:helix-turn-helix transcriptional regulator [Paraburkholderia azotifigens]|uniref:AlpA family phage regulatory protein n=1 Tax=Paraburkholderia azotifigens TaxID=2057004 RepID=A0ABU9R3J5_9BURK